MARKKKQAQVLAVIAFKGGCGKTATSGALAQAATREGRRVLAVDLDPQGNLSLWLGAQLNGVGAFEVLKGRANIKDAIQKTDGGIDVLRGTSDLSSLTTKTGSGLRLSQALEEVAGLYDLVIIDTPPSLGELTYNAINAAHGVIAPVEVSTFALQSLYRLEGLLELMSKRHDVAMLGYVLTCYNPRANLDRFMLGQFEEAAEKAGTCVLGCVRRGQAVRESMAMQADLYDYAPRSKPTQDYLTLYEHVKAATKK